MYVGHPQSVGMLPRLAAEGRRPRLLGKANDKRIDVPNMMTTTQYFEHDANQACNAVCVAAGLTTLATAFVCYRIERYWAKHWVLPNRVEKRSVETISIIDSDDTAEVPVDEENMERDEEGKYTAAALAQPPPVPTNPRDPNYKRFACRIAREVRVKMGLPSRTEANRLVAVELVSKALLAHNVRKTDIFKFQTLAADMVFLPTIWDQMAIEDRHSEAYRERLKPIGRSPLFTRICEMGRALIGESPRGPAMAYGKQ